MPLTLLFGSREPGRGHVRGIFLSGCWAPGVAGWECGGVRNLGRKLVMSGESALPINGTYSTHSRLPAETELAKEYACVCTEYFVITLAHESRAFPPRQPEKSAPPGVTAQGLESMENSRMQRGTRHWRLPSSPTHQSWDAQIPLRLNRHSQRLCPHDSRRFGLFIPVVFQQRVMFRPFERHYAR